MSANLAPEDFLRSNDKKVRRSNAPFYRELQNCEKSLVKSKSSKNNAEDFPRRKFVILLFVKVIFYFLMDFFIPKKSTIGKISMAAMQKIPISRDFTKAQEAIPHRSKGTPHAQYGTFQRKSNPKRISKPIIKAG